MTAPTYRVVFLVEGYSQSNSETVEAANETVAAQLVRGKFPAERLEILSVTPLASGIMKTPTDYRRTCEVCEKNVAGSNYAGHFEQQFHTFFVQGSEVYFHQACLALFVTGQVITNRKALAAFERHPFIFPDCEAHRFLPTNNNPVICQLCGGHQGNHTAELVQ